MEILLIIIGVFMCKELIKAIVGSMNKDVPATVSHVSEAMNIASDSLPEWAAAFTAGTITDSVNNTVPQLKDAMNCKDDKVVTAKQAYYWMKEHQLS